MCWLPLTVKVLYSLTKHYDQRTLLVGAVMCTALRLLDSSLHRPFVRDAGKEKLGGVFGEEAAVTMDGGDGSPCNVLDLHFTSWHSTWCLGCCFLACL